MSRVSLAGEVQGWGLSSDHQGFCPEADTYKLAV